MSEVVVVYAGRATSTCMCTAFRSPARESVVVKPPQMTTRATATTTMSELVGVHVLASSAAWRLLRARAVQGLPLEATS